MHVKNLFSTLVLSLLMAILAQGQASASHLLAADLSYEYLSPNTYEFTLVTYSDPSFAFVDRCAADFAVFDSLGTSIATINDVPRMNGPATDPLFPNLPCNLSPQPPTGDYVFSTFKRNIYTFTYTFTSQGTFFVEFADPARTVGIINLPNSDQTTLQLSVMVRNDGANRSSPRFLNHPLNFGCANDHWEHNPGTHNPEGDSMTVSWYVPESGHRTAAAGFVPADQVSPGPANQLSIDPENGNIQWDTPQQMGYYAFGIQAETWCNGFMVAQSRREFSILIKGCTNAAPEIWGWDTLDVLPNTTSFQFSFNVLGAPFDSLYLYWNDGDRGLNGPLSVDSTSIVGGGAVAGAQVFTSLPATMVLADSDYVSAVFYVDYDSSWYRPEPYFLDLVVHNNFSYSDPQSPNVMRFAHHTFKIYMQDSGIGRPPCPLPLPIDPREPEEGRYMNPPYPNPFSNVVHFDVYVPKEVDHAELRVVDVQGRLIKVMPVSERGTFTLDLQKEGLRHGIYLVELVGDEVLYGRHKVVSIAW